jgi:YD repeat-containing protein
MWRRVHLIGLLVVVMMLGVGVGVPASAQSRGIGACDNVSYLMSRNITPYDMVLSGGVLSSGAPQNGTLGAGAYADFWSFSLTRPRNQNNVLQELPVTIRFSNVSGADLEFALFNGLFAVINYQPVANGDVAYRPTAETGAYTLVVRKVNLADESPGNYSVTVTSDGMGSPNLSIRDETTNRDFFPAPELSNGVARITPPAATVFIHPDGTRRVHPRFGQSTQIFMPNERGDFSAHTINIGNWANKLAFLGGDLAATGTERIYFLSRFDSRVNISGASPAELNLQNVRYADDTIIRTDWGQVYGIWVMDGCTGFKLRDGRTFTAPTPRTGREIRAEGALNAFIWVVNSLIGDRAVRHSAVFDWSNVRELSQITLREGVYEMELVADRRLTLQTTDMTATNTPQNSDIAQSNITLNDQAVTIIMNWVNIRAFSLRDNTITFDFLDSPRTTTTRDGTNISRIETIDEIIQLIYKEQGGIAGEQRLMLPASDSYLEIVTPPGNPPFNGTAKAGKPDYFPRALPHTGGDCYPTNTTIPEANCPPAGHINPANGNLWLPINDHTAFGGIINLDLTRHYNSAYAHLDSPFGKGWSSPYLLDYNVVYDTVTNSRIVTSVTMSRYLIGLDVIYAPRGVVTFITPTGSRHQFVGDSNTLRAVTMPGWRLSRGSISDNWRLSQEDGMLYEFDRAGRLIRYGYPTYGRVVTIDYPRTNLNGAADIGTETAVIITDHIGDFAPRRLELYYNDQHRIIKSILRDMTIGADESTCTLDDNCQQILYTYSSDGLLTRVDYPDGTVALYEYDENGRMTRIDDPRAPIAHLMNITYDADGEVITTQVGDSPTVYQQASVNITNTSRVSGITDRLGNRVNYTYTLAAGDLRAVGTSYQLTQTTSPLAGTGERLEDLPTNYRWGGQDVALAGFLTRIDARTVGNDLGRGSVEYGYTPTGQLRCTPCTFDSRPKVDIAYEENPQGVFRPTRITYPDNTSEQFTYDANRLLVRYIDRDGADYALTWSDIEPYQLLRMTRTNDNTTWEYLYNPVGQVINITQSIPDDTLPYQVSYQWDGLGRLIGVTDSVLGRYTIDYPAPTADEAGAIRTEIHQTDPVGAVTISIFDTRGQLIETRVEQNGLVIQKTTYEYDVLGRAVAITDWVGDIGGDLTPVTTRIDYTPTPSYLNTANATVTVRGETHTITDPFGRTSSTVYDALGRVRRTISIDGVINDYTYDTDPSAVNGLQIIQETVLQGTPFTNRAEYGFDSARQLRRVRVGTGGINDTTPVTQEWTITYSGRTNRLNVMNINVARSAFIREMTWGEYASGQPSVVNMNLANIPMTSGFNVETTHKPTLGAVYDFLGRATTINTGEGRYNVAYCPLSTGGTKVVYGALGATVDCTTTNAAQTLSYDVHERLIEATDDYGRRVITYTPNLSLGVWDVKVALTSASGESTWALQFNALGLVTKWIDQNGVVYDYTYDTRGRLVAISVADMPEMSYTFEYNALDQLTQQQDEFGRGFSYNYNPQGRVISKVDLKTADAISYTYTPNGLLSSVTSSDGGTTVYLYEDRSQPTRLTRIIEPTGAQHRFTWVDTTTADIPANTLIYTDPFNNRTHYQYDASGLLWRIDDPTPRSSEVLYDDAGNITDLLTNVTSASAVSQRFTLTRPAPQTLNISDSSRNGTGWSRNFAFYHDGTLARAGDATFTYDALGRLVNIAIEDQRQWALEWGSESIITLTEPFAGASVLNYDALHRLVSRSVRDTTLRYTYTRDANIPVMRVEHPLYGVREYAFSPGSAREGLSPTVFLRAHGQQTAYVYDGDARLRQIITRVCSDVSYDNLADCQADNQPIYETRITITYNTAGLPIRISDQDGALETFAYDDMNRLIAYQNANGRNFVYGYDDASRLTRLITATGVKLLLRYDSLGSMTGICRTRASESDDYAACASAGGEIETYSYDTLRRLIARTYGNTTVNFRYNADSQLVSMGDTSFNYIPTIGLLSSVSISNGGEYTFTYNSVNRLATMGDTTFTYNPLGDLIAQNDRITNLTLRYEQNRQQFSFIDVNNQLDYTLDPRGYLAQIGYNDAPLLTLNYPTAQQLTDVEWDDGTQIFYTLDNQRQTEAYLFGGLNEMSVYYDLSDAGNIRRQNIILPFAEGGEGGYVAIYGYDADERPITLRITDFQGFTVLFAQSITYNPLGWREGETWQYADGTQVIIRYIYTNDRLTQRRVSIIGANARNLIFDYTYDQKGNLTRIAETTSNTECASLRYDGANRLVGITRDSVNTAIAYDAYGRLVSAGDVRVSYRGAGTDVMALAVGRDVAYVGAVDQQPAQFLVGRGGDVTWLVNDGRKRTILPYIANTEPSNEVWLFDALGRYVPLTTPDFANPCLLNGKPANLSPLLSVQPLADGAMWLADVGVYIQDGRSYESEMALFTQRANTVDALGNMYASQTGNAVYYPNTPRQDGLRLLRDALMRGQINTILSAHAVRQTYLPHIADDSHLLANAQQGARTPLQITTHNALFLADWLATRYNLGSAYRDENGYLRLPANDFPLQSGDSGAYLPPFQSQIPAWDALLISSVRPSQTILSGLMEDSRLIQPPRAYIGYTSTPLLHQAWDDHRPSLPITADAVLNWLPTPLIAPQYGADALDFADAVAQLWTYTDADWAQARLNDHLPTMPDLPPLTLDAWRETAFTTTILDPMANYGALYPTMPDMPRYRWGLNIDWLGTGR